MAGDFKIKLYSHSGVQYAEMVNFLELAYSKQVGQPDIIAYKIDPESSGAIAGGGNVVSNGDQIEIWRRNVTQGIDWYIDSRGLITDLDDYREINKPLVRTVNALGDLKWLKDRIIAYYAGVANKSLFTAVAAESIMKTLVNYNCTSNATVGNGRLLTQSNINRTITVQADGAGGNLVTTQVGWQNLLDTLFNLSKPTVGGGDYDLIKTGATTWDFRWYLGQRGVDRHASLIFSEARNNITSLRVQNITSTHVGETFVGGPGENSDRAITVQGYTGVANAYLKDSESFLNGTNLADNNSRIAAANAAMYKTRAVKIPTFNVRQTPKCAYGSDYCVSGVLGDLVTVEAPAGTTSTYKVAGVTVAYKPGAPEQIDLQMVTQ